MKGYKLVEKKNGEEEWVEISKKRKVTNLTPKKKKRKK